MRCSYWPLTLMALQGEHQRSPSATPVCPSNALATSRIPGHRGHLLRELPLTELQGSTQSVTACGPPAITLSPPPRDRTGVRCSPGSTQVPPVCTAPRGLAQTRPHLPLGRVVWGSRQENRSLRHLKWPPTARSAPGRWPWAFGARGQLTAEHTSRKGLGAANSHCGTGTDGFRERLSLSSASDPGERGRGRSGFHWERSRSRGTGRKPRGRHAGRLSRVRVALSLALPAATRPL